MQPAIIVIFGVTGDLAKRYLLPALYHLIKDDLLHEKTEIIGVSRRKVSANELLKEVELCVNEQDGACDERALERFRRRFRMARLDPVEPADYDELLKTLNSLEEIHGLCMNRLYYLSIPPSVYRPVVRNLGRAGLNKSCQHGEAATRLLVEKPFGYDQASAEELITETNRWFSRQQVFRIDHYLAKETVQNILTFRKTNPIFSTLWSNEHIGKITIEAYEKIGVEGRASFYENMGALRDLVQSHLMQLLALVTMDLPKDDNSHSLHAAKQQLLAATQPVKPNQINKTVKRGQYKTYRREVGSPYSNIETFVRLQLAIANERWIGVPVMLVTGKALNKKRTAITVEFKAEVGSPSNQLVFRIQPNEGIGLELCVKKPDFVRELQVAEMDFSYQNTFGDHGHPTAYERVLVDAVRGDQSLFATDEEVLESWRVLQPVLDAWSVDSSDLFFYPSGSNPSKFD